MTYDEYGCIIQTYGKKGKHNDDAMCLIELLHIRGFVKKKKRMSRLYDGGGILIS